MEFNDDEIVALLNRLLEKLHQADSNHQGSIVLNIYEKGSLHVDHVDTQNFYGDACPKPQKEKGNIDAPTLPTRSTRHRTGDGAVAESAGCGLCGCQLSTAYFPNAGSTAGRCDSGAAGHQGEVESVRGPVEQEIHAQ